MKNLFFDINIAQWHNIGLGIYIVRNVITDEDNDPLLFYPSLIIGLIFINIRIFYQD